jgi:hypothetical protein
LLAAFRTGTRRAVVRLAPDFLPAADLVCFGFAPMIRS